MDQPSIDKREDHKLEGATAAFFSPALHDWLSTKQPHHVSCINNTVSQGSSLHATECAVKRLSSYVTRRIPITKSSKSFVSLPALTVATLVALFWLFVGSCIHQIFRITIPSFLNKITLRLAKSIELFL